jgi:hypothetical protein
MKDAKRKLAKRMANSRHEGGESAYTEREETRMENKGWSEARSERRAHKLAKMR